MPAAVFCVPPKIVDSVLVMVLLQPPKIPEKAWLLLLQAPPEITLLIAGTAMLLQHPPVITEKFDERILQNPFPTVE